MNKTIEQKLEGWGFDMEALKESEGAFSLSPPKGPRAFSTNVSNDLPNYCHYSGLVSTMAYME